MDTCAASGAHMQENKALVSLPPRKVVVSVPGGGERHSCVLKNGDGNRSGE